MIKQLHWQLAVNRGGGGGCRRMANPIHRVGEEKLRERYKHRDEKVRQRYTEARGYSAPLQHIAHSSCILVFKHEFLANE